VATAQRTVRITQPARVARVPAMISRDFSNREDSMALILLRLFVGPHVEPTIFNLYDAPKWECLRESFGFGLFSKITAVRERGFHSVVFVEVKRLWLLASVSARRRLVFHSGLTCRRGREYVKKERKRKKKN
jgi:hypothetical protein